jgi:hypothetical protein
MRKKIKICFSAIDSKNSFICVLMWCLWRWRRLSQRFKNWCDGMFKRRHDIRPNCIMLIGKMTPFETSTFGRFINLLWYYVLFSVILRNVILPSVMIVILLNKILLCVILQNVIRLKVIMVSVILLIVILPNVFLIVSFY